MHSWSRLTCAEFKLLPVTHPYTENITHGYSTRLLRFKLGCFRGNRKLGRHLSSYVKKAHFQSDKKPNDITFLQKKIVLNYSPITFTVDSCFSFKKQKGSNAKKTTKKTNTRSKRKLSFANDSFDEPLPFHPLKLERVFKSYCNVGRS